VRDGSSDAPGARGDRSARDNHESGEDFSADVDPDRPKQLCRKQDQREQDDAMNPDDTVFDHERAKFLVLDFDLAGQADIGMTPAAHCLALEGIERTRMTADRVKRDWVISRAWRQFRQIEP
jgi:hypothetical protein